MRYEKDFTAPAETFFFERLTPDKMRDADNGRKLSLYHVRESAHGLVCGEGYEEMCGLDRPVGGLYLADRKIYCYETDSGSLFEVTERRRYVGAGSFPTAAVKHFREDGTGGVYWLFLSSVKYSENGKLSVLGSYGGVAAVLHHERMFFVKERSLYYTRPFSSEGPENLSHDPHGFGRIDFSTEDGDFVGIASFRNRLYLFREKGILRVRADGEALNFSAETLPYACGKIVAGSVADCGDRLAFITDRGLYSFDGSTYRFAGSGDTEEMDLSSVHASSYLGKYFAFVKRAEGNAIYLYDFERNYGRFLFASPMNDATAGAEAFFVSYPSVYRLTEQGALPKGGAECSLRLTLQKPMMRLGWVRIVGTGEFTVRIGTREKRVKAGEKFFVSMRPSPQTEITVRSDSPDFAISAIDVLWRQTNDDRYH